MPLLEPSWDDRLGSGIRVCWLGAMDREKSITAVPQQSLALKHSNPGSAEDRHNRQADMGAISQAGLSACLSMGSNRAQALPV